MTYIRRMPKSDWRSSLTTEERRAVGDIEQEIATVDKRRRVLSRDLHVLRNRAIKRRDYAAARRT